MNPNPNHNDREDEGRDYPSMYGPEHSRRKSALSRDHQQQYQPHASSSHNSYSDVDVRHQDTQPEYLLAANKSVSTPQAFTFVEPFASPPADPSYPPHPKDPILRIGKEAVVDAKAPKMKAKRRRADAEQLQALRAVFERTAFPNTEERAMIAKDLNLTPRQIQIWFQNRRAALKPSRKASTSSTPSSSLARKDIARKDSGEETAGSPSS